MGRAKKSLLAFNAGELTPKLDGRIDTEKYAKGCRQLQNFIPFTTGGVTRRKGFEFIAAAKFDPSVQASRCSFIKFQFSRTQTFLIEVGEAYMRFYFEGNQIQSGGAPYEIVSPYTADDAANIQYVQINDVVFITHPAYPPYSLSRIADNNWTMAKIAYLPPPFLDGNITATTITPSAMTGNITLTASAATFLPAHVGGLWAVNYNRTVTQIDQTITSNTISASSLFVDGGYTVITSGTWTADVVIQSSVDGGTTWVEVIRYKGTSNINKNATFTQTPPALIRIKIENWVSQSNAANVTVEASDSLVYGIVEITGYTSSTVVSGTVRKTLFDTTATTYWAEAAWSPLRGYPAAICFFQSRLFYGGTLYQPDTVWGCVVDDYYNFTTGTDDSASVAFTIASEDRNQIIWMIGQDRIIAGTSGGEFSIGGSDIKETIAPANIFVKKQSNFGSTTSRPLVIGNAVLFIRRTGLKVMEVIYDSIRQLYVSSNLAELSDHLLAGGLRSPCYQADRDSIFWGISDRGLIGMTYEKEQNVIAWHRHTTQGTFEAVETIYGTLDDEVWVSVIRTIGGTQYRFIERMTGYYNPSIDYFPPSVASDGAWTPFNLDNLVGGNASSYAGARNPYWPAPWDHGQLNNLGFATGQIFTGQSASANGIPSGIPSSPLSLDLSSLYSQYETASFPITAAPGNNTGWPSGSISAPFYAAGVHPDLGFWYGSICGIFRDASGNTMPLRSFGIYIAADSDGTSVTVNFLNNAGKIVNTQSSAIPISTAQFFGCYSLDESVVGFQVMSNGGKFALVNSVGPGLAGHFDPNIPVQYPGDQSTETFVDSCIIATPSSPSVTVTGLDHLEGMTVSVLTDGAVHPDCVVSSGSITLNYPATVIHVGLRYDSIVQPMRLDSDDQAGNTQGVVKQLRSLDLRLMDTLGGSMANGEVGSDGLNQFYPLQFRSTEDLMDAAPPLFTGELSHDIEGNMDNDSTFIIKQSDPLPFTLLSATVKYEVLGAS